jgi:GT2 family glycosyltransferase
VSADASVSVCIRTLDRLDAVEQVLISVGELDYTPSEVIVLDDSPTGSARALIEERFPQVTYVEGPRRGIGASCNHVVREASGDYVLMLDDDVVVTPGSLRRLIECAVGSRKTIASSLIREPDLGVIEPRDQGFLGFQDQDYSPGDVVKTVVMPATLFPRGVFDEVRFDERVLAYEEVDFANRAVASGYEIVVCRDVVNEHNPLRKPSWARYGPALDAARLYVTFKRYAVTEKKRLRALCFALYAPLHVLGSSVKAEGLAGVRRAGQVVWLAAGYVASYAREAHRSGA